MDVVDVPSKTPAGGRMWLGGVEGGEEEEGRGGKAGLGRWDWGLGEACVPGLPHELHCRRMVPSD